MLSRIEWDKKPEYAEEWRNILSRAADLIDARGLAKCIQEDSEGRLCIHGAITLADKKPLYWTSLDPDSDLSKACEGICNYLHAQGWGEGVSKRGAAYWNNRPERTKDEVVEALRNAAKEEMAVG